MISENMGEFQSYSRFTSLLNSTIVINYFSSFFFFIYLCYLFKKKKCLVQESSTNFSYTNNIFLKRKIFVIKIRSLNEYLLIHQEYDYYNI